MNDVGGVGGVDMVVSVPTFRTEAVWFVNLYRET